jgi:phosphate transport system protein
VVVVDAGRSSSLSARILNSGRTLVDNLSNIWCRGGNQRDHQRTLSPRPERSAAKDVRWEWVAMREEFRSSLKLVRGLLVDMATAVRASMHDATIALLDADKPRAEAAVARDADVHRLAGQVDDLVYRTTALQAPVATDLRILFTALHVVMDLTRMADLAAHVVRTALRRLPDAGVPDDIRDLFRDLGDGADRMAAKMVRVLSDPDIGTAAELDTDDDLMDQLHSDLIARMLRPDRPQDTATAMDLVLLGRFYERYADHAVNAGHQMTFLLTGTAVRS